MADEHPETGDTYACTTCGMAILLTEDCKSDSGGPFFSCCGEQMEKTGKKSE